MKPKHLILLIFLSLFMFSQSLYIYFVQDDFWLLQISQAKSLSEFSHFFIPLLDVPWYRPLSSQVFFFLGQEIFGLQPFLFHVVVFATHIGTALLLYQLINLITRQKSVALLAVMLYATHQIHLLGLSWLAAYSFVLGPFFMVTILLCWERKRILFAFIFFILGILTSEVLVMLPILLFMREWFRSNKISLKIIWFLIPPILLLFIRYVLFPSHLHTTIYQLSLSYGTFRTLLVYLYRIIGLPLNIDSMPNTLSIATIIFSFIFLILLCSGWLFGSKYLNKENQLLTFLSWSIISLVPFAFLTNHISPHYLSFALIGIAPSMSLLVHALAYKTGNKSRLFLFITVIIYITNQYIGIQWVLSDHWLYRRAVLAEKLVQSGKLIHPVGSEEYFSLGANAASFLYR